MTDNKAQAGEQAERLITTIAAWIEAGPEPKPATRQAPPIAFANVSRSIQFVNSHPAGNLLDDPEKVARRSREALEELERITLDAASPDPDPIHWRIHTTDWRTDPNARDKGWAITWTRFQLMAEWATGSNSWARIDAIDIIGRDATRKIIDHL